MLTNHAHALTDERSKRCTYIGVYIMVLVLAQVILYGSNASAQSTQQSGSGTSARRFGFTITNNYGVSVSSTNTSGYQLEGEARMGILPGSFITNQSSSTGVDMRSNGITVTGVNAGLTLNLDPDKTIFTAKLKKIGDLNSTNPESSSETSTSASAGTASISATGSATTIFTVESSETVTNNVFTKVF